MNKIVNIKEAAASQPASIEETQWQARVDLAAAHRLAVNAGYNEGIFNHFTARVPGTDDRYYQIPFGLHWAEVTASNLMEVAYDGTVLKGDGEAETSAYAIHAPVHKKIAIAEAVFHTHMPFSSALTRLEDPRIKPIGQTELRVMSAAIYEEDYRGLAFDDSEGNRMAELLDANPGRNTIFMANHGVLTVGSIAQAYDRLYYAERAAQVQLYAMWTGQPLKYLSDEVIAETKAGWAKLRRYGDKNNAEHHFDSLKRLLDRTQPDYRD